MNKIVLASKSVFRAQLLENAGVPFVTEAANIDEREVEAPLLQANLSGADVAEVLAIAKATDVSARNMDAWVIGSDQTLTFEEKLLHKPTDMDEARRRILEFSGKTHELNSAVSLVRNGDVLWSHNDVSAITFRNLDPAYVGRYAAEAGDTILSSVGAYQIEGHGINLFEKIKGDYFSIMGLPLLPLLAELRRLKLIDG